ncbi:MAG: sigma 54-interacting transcriptional regulator, partial [Candidatus Aminicenantes bacterium]|nr:sigma 54-interacting transcriptional regulator [Candidatus Aminicenantes bacterium]
MNRAHILVVEDDPLQRRLIKENLEGEGYLVFDAANGRDAILLAEQYPLDLAVVDYQLGSETGTEVIVALLQKNPLITPLVVTAFGNIEHAVEAIRKGAYDYIVKPLDFKKFLLVIERALERQRLQKEITRLKSSIEDKFNPKNFIHTSPRMQEVVALMGRASQSSATVLITGETGTGKDLVARTIHFASQRKDGPFLPVNIPSLPESLVESELFGAEKGAFTGAGERRTGKFEAADGGTLYLDEIGDLILHL